MEFQKPYHEQVSTLLQELDRNIEELSAKAAQASVEAKQEFNTQMAMLRARQAAVRDQLQQVIDKGDDVTDDLKGGLDRAVDGLRQAMATANDRLN
jgi:glycine cleavage system regulatory protein